MNKFLLTFILLTVLQIVFTKDKCYVLALEGGGDHGAYQAGAFKALAYGLPVEERSYDVITGISAGTLNGAGISLFPIGEETQAADFLLKIWDNINKDSIYKNWKNLGYLGYLWGLLYETSIFDTSPLRKLITEILESKKVQRNFYMGINNIRTGGYEVYNGLELDIEELINVALSSSAVPVVFTAISLKNGDLYQDGGVKHGIDPVSGINHCKNQGFTEENIVVDMIKCFGKKDRTKDPSKFKTIDAMFRLFDIWNADRSSRDIDELTKFYPNIHFRYVVVPTKELPSGLLNFNKENTLFMLQTGEQDAKDIIAKGTQYGKIQMKEIAENYKNQPNSIKRAVPTEEKNENFLN